MREKQHPLKDILVDFLLCIEEFKTKYQVMSAEAPVGPAGRVG